MGYEELLNSLEKECEEKIRNIWQEANAAADALRTQTEARLKEVEGQCCRENTIIEQGIKETAFLEARRKAETLLLEAEQKLASRLYERAVSALLNIRGSSYGRHFKALCRELPPCQWETVTVNPEDRELAMQHFPDAEIITDTSLIGGMSVSGFGGNFCVNNTLEKRLERAWPDIIPRVFRALRSHLPEYGTPREN